MNTLKRFAEQPVAEAIGDTPVVLLVGPRRAGKTTLVRQFESDGRPYVTLDDQAALDAARTDPAGFVRGLDQVIIDEVQRVPELLLAIKKSVDDNPEPGRFLLTGSANVLTMSRVADSLAGRMEVVRLFPLSQAEMAERTPAFLERLFAASPSFRREQGEVQTGSDLVRRVLVGGFPEAVARERETRHRQWQRAYLESILVRDLRDVADLERLSELPRFVRVIAAQTGGLVNYSELGRSIGVSYKTSQRYVDLLEQVFLLTTLTPWFSNQLKRTVKSPKLHFVDSGLLAAWRGLSAEKLATDRNAFGSVLETFVLSEVLKLAVGADVRFTPHHFRVDRDEVDVVLERDDGAMAALEIKASATVQAKDFSGIRKLAAASKGRFVYGAVLYDGDDVIPFDSHLAAVPIASLWH